MKRKFLLISAGVSVLALGAIAGVSLGNNVNSAFAADHEHTDACAINHYAQVNPTSTTHGVKEYWVCCTNHETMFSAPSAGTISDATHDDEFAIASDDNRYIAPITLPADFSSGSVTLDSSNKHFTSTVGGYDGKVITAKYTEVIASNGGMYLFIGSYGFYLRGGGVRYAEVSGSSYKEVRRDDSPCSDKRYLNATNPSNGELTSGTILGLSISIKDDSTVTASIYQNFTLIGSCDYARSSSEIASADAKFEVEIVPSYTSSCVISSPEA